MINDGSTDKIIVWVILNSILTKDLVIESPSVLREPSTSNESIIQLINSCSDLESLKSKTPFANIFTNIIGRITNLFDLKIINANLSENDYKILVNQLSKIKISSFRYLSQRCGKFDKS